MKNGRGGSNDGRDDYADEVQKVTGNGLNKQAAANGLQDGMNGQRRSRGGQGISQSALDNAPPSMLPSRGLNHSPSSQNISPDDYYANQALNGGKKNLLGGAGSQSKMLGHNGS